MPVLLDLHSALPEAADGQPPEWVQLLPVGVWRGTDGRGPYSYADADAGQVLNATRQHLPAPLDENHSTDLAAPRGGPSPARAWIREVQHRPGEGLFGRVDWTGTGRQLMAERAYRGISPVIDRAKDGRILAVVRAALTNNPNFPLRSLHARGGAMDLMERLRQLLGLDSNADDTNVLSALETMLGDRQLQSQGLGTIAGLLGLGTDAKADAIAAAARQRLAAPASGTPVAQLETQVRELQAALDTERTRAATERATRFIDGAIREGRAGVNALRAHYIERHAREPEAVEREISAMPKLNAGGITAPPPQGEAAALTAEDQRIIELMGSDPEAFKAQKAAQQRELHAHQQMLEAR